MQITGDRTRPFGTRLPGAMLALLALLALPACSSLSSSSEKRIITMDFSDFLEAMNDKDEFVITVGGALEESFFTGKKYVHYETVAYYGSGDIRSTYQILFHTEGEVAIQHDDIRVKTGYRLIRTRLGPAFEKAVARGDCDPDDRRGRALLEILTDAGEERLLLEEYGLEAGKRYHAWVTTERYSLPPAGPDGKPKHRENRVITISDSPRSENAELTPLYKNWSY